MFLALHIPDFPVQAALRALREQPAKPCVILAGRDEREPQEKVPILAVDDRAHEAGIHAGWPLNRALVRCPDLQVLTRDPLAEARLCDDLVRLGELIGPDLEITASDTAVIDLASRRLPLGNALNAMELEGVSIWHAQAGTADLAHLASTHPETIGRSLDPSHVECLPLDVLTSVASGREIMERLGLWGLKTVGDFMKLPRQDLTERLGPEAGRCHDLLHGRSCRLLRLHRPPESFAQSFDCDDSIISLDPLIFVVKRMLHTLAGRLGARHLAARTLDLRLQMENGAQVSRQITMPEPQCRVEGMLSPLQTFLEALKLDAPVTVLHLDATTTFATAAQREWFGRQLPQPERWAETLARLEALLGQGRVGIPVPWDTYRADAFTVRPAIGPATPTPDSMRPAGCGIPLSRYRPPQPVSVGLREAGVARLATCRPQRTHTRRDHRLPGAFFFLR